MTVMKLDLLAAITVASMLAVGTTLAQDNSGANRRGQGRGYGGPPQSNEARAARQAACLEKNGGVCPNGGPRAECSGLGQGQGQGRGFCRGQGQSRGLRDGTGPRSGDGTCPLGNTPRQRARR